ncbi:MAG: hypothetical protein P4N41_02025 [Negativicutes bacterium]|nr:hypothetical protein [Negativicutes bacterium]
MFGHVLAMAFTAIVAIAATTGVVLLYCIAKSLRGLAGRAESPAAKERVSDCPQG